MVLEIHLNDIDLLLNKKIGGGGGGSPLWLQSWSWQIVCIYNTGSVAACVERLLSAAVFGDLDMYVII